MLFRYITCFLVGTILISSPAFAHFSEDPNIGEAIMLVADRLENKQKTGGPETGAWPKEKDYTGSIAAGMVAAYQRTCDERYKTSAELGGSYILGSAGGNYYGDEAFALARLSKITDDPTNNSWRNALAEFYSIIENSPSGTSGYIAWFETGAEDSSAVFYLAHLLIAAYYVDANDKVIWRDSLPGFLAQVDDNSLYPVMALGTATWALAQSGPLDSTLVDSDGSGRPYWNSNSVTLADLPGLVSSHQVPESNEPNDWSGSFYWNFVHADANSGGTEDTIFSVLALVAAQRADPDLNYDAEILAAKQALFNAIEPDGSVYAHIWGDSPDAHLYAGEILTALGDLVIDGDFNLDDVVDEHDLARLAENWLSSCSGSCLCNVTDLDESGTVNFIDFAILAENWLRSDVM